MVYNSYNVVDIDVWLPQRVCIIHHRNDACVYLPVFGLLRIRNFPTLGKVSQALSEGSISARTNGNTPDYTEAKTMHQYLAHFFHPPGKLMLG